MMSDLPDEATDRALKQRLRPATSPGSPLVPDPVDAVRTRMRRRGRRRRGLTIVAATVILAAVGVITVGGGNDDESLDIVAPPGTLTTADDAASDLRGVPYLLSDAPKWQVRNAVDPAPDDPVSSIEVSLSWYVEYERFPDPDTSQMIRVSGHDATRPAVQAQYPGADFSPVDIDGTDAIGGKGNDGPAVILAAVGGQTPTVMVLSYELSVDELVTWSRSLHPATDTQWIEAGGEVHEP